MRHRKSNSVQGGVLYSPSILWPGIVVDTAEWYAWLNEAEQFHYEDTTTSYTARKEWRGACDFWYAYTKIDGKLRKHYLGKSFDLTPGRLHDAAKHFYALVSVG